jgi:hypothetical protein
MLTALGSRHTRPEKSCKTKVVYKFPQRIWSDTDITELSDFRNKSICAGDLNTKLPVWNIKVSNLSGLKRLELFLSLNFEISAPQTSTHYTPRSRGHVLDIIVRQNVRLSDVTVTDIIDSDHLPIMFNIPLKNWQTGNSFKASILNSYLEISKFSLLMKLIKQRVILQHL